MDNALQPIIDHYEIAMIIAPKMTKDDKKDSAAKKHPTNKIINDIKSWLGQRKGKSKGGNKGKSARPSSRQKSGLGLDVNSDVKCTSQQQSLP